MAKQLMLFDCAEHANKRLRVSEAWERDIICDDVVVRDNDDDISSGSTANLTSTTQVRGNSHLELLMNDQESGDDRTAFCLYGSPSSVVESEINAENEVLYMQYFTMQFLSTIKLWDQLLPHYNKLAYFVPFYVNDDHSSAP